MIDSRIKIFTKFKEFEARILVSTEIFGRGVDFQGVNIVINYDMAAKTDDYLHRVGRAGRFGTKGLAISFIAAEEDTKTMEETQQRFEIEIEDMPESIDSSLYMNS